MTGFTKQSKPFILGVAGGSGSGKTYFARDLQKHLGRDVVEIIYQDNFYIDQSKNFDFDGGSVNFDHPNSIDFDLLAEQIATLKTGHSINVPIYDFTTHKRSSQTLFIQPKPIIIVDGILIFHAPQVRKHFDDMVFFDTPEDLRFERGRTPEGVKNQFLKQVKPMHDEFVEPSKKYANTVIREVSEYNSVLEKYLNILKSKI